MEKKHFLSVVINTKNSAKTLEAALKSVRDYADEIVVMDMHSSDDTEKIAKKFDCNFYTHPDVGYVEPARNAAIEQAKGEWIFILDADEEAPPILKEFIAKLPDTSTDGYFVPRANIIFGRVVHTGWWPDYILRLFRKDHVRWGNELHAVPSITGTTEYLPATKEYAILHHNYDSIDSYIDRAQRYASIEAESLNAKNKKPNIQKAFFGELIQRYYGWEGGKDKSHGVFLSYLQGAQKIIEQSKLWEIQGFNETSQPKLSEMLTQAAADARYWEAHWKMEKSHGLAKLIWQIRRKFRV